MMVTKMLGSGYNPCACILSNSTSAFERSPCLLHFIKHLECIFQFARFPKSVNDTIENLLLVKKEQLRFPP
ncbi:hypothetical protein HanIR_Chr14g0676171 [Helianthus annuus]|nr:hypothetical protein HanIR_Chr14g0676171 [Helianthus annuus]